jgi:hypothetical protein
VELPATLPPSLFLSSRPSWWPATTPWPPIGPDVTGGNADPAGHAFKTPAQACYENTIAKGNPFDPVACYGN